MIANLEIANSTPRSSLKLNSFFISLVTEAWNPAQREARYQFHVCLNHLERSAHYGSISGWLVRRGKIEALALEAGIEAGEGSELDRRLHRLNKLLYHRARERVFRHSRYFLDQSTAALRERDFNRAMEHFEKAQRLMEYGKQLGREVLPLGIEA